MVVFLIGYMGCGKSTVGRRLARTLGYDFVDMDSEIEREEGMSVADIFAQKGESYFRAKETEHLERYASGSRIVVATGGGAPCVGNNMEVMHRGGAVTVYLKMSPAKLVERLGGHGREKRPLIRGMNDGELLEFIGRTLPGREEIYERARLVIACDRVSDDYIASHIEQYIKYLQK